MLANCLYFLINSKIVLIRLVLEPIMAAASLLRNLA